MSIPEKTTVAAIIKTKSEASDGYKIELEIASFNSKFPTIVTRVPESIAAQLKAGQSANLNLVRQSLKGPNQKGEPKSGNYWSDYYWGIEGIATAVATPPAPGHVQGTATSPPVAYTPATEVNADKDTRIVRESCLSSAVAFVHSTVGVISEATPEKVLAVAAQFEAWVIRKTPNQAPEVKEVPQQAPTQGTELFWPTLKNWNDLLILASKNAIPSSEVFTILGIGNVAEWKQSIDEAWVKVATARKLTPESIKR